MFVDDHALLNHATTGSGRDMNTFLAGPIRPRSARLVRNSANIQHAPIAARLYTAAPHVLSLCSRIKIGGISTRPSNSNSINPSSLAARTSIISEQIELPARMKAIRVSTAQKYPNRIHCGTMLAKTPMPAMWNMPKRIGGNPSIQPAAIAALFCNRESGEAVAA